MGDDAARQAALDPRQSFIVQAPAGSGKTELLIQRYLALLATVEAPEQIVAITFTRKAAAEMRQRVLESLRAAAAGEEGRLAHRARTIELAAAALRRSAALDWSLPAAARRIRIETLDALNARLARQLPALSGGAAGGVIVEEPGAQYALAALRTVAELGRTDALGHALRDLLKVLENSVPRLEGLLAGLLPRRELWLRHLAPRGGAALRSELEQALAGTVADELATASALLPATAAAELESLLAHAAAHAQGPDAELLAAADDAAGPPDATAHWLAVAHLLLTKQGAWRRKLDRGLGFGAEHPEPRRRLRRLLDGLADREALREALNGIRRLPAPRYSDAEWRRLEALRIVLLHLTAELRVVFSEQQTVDFVELALAARQALGRTDAPSELLLALDRRIQHVLVDEFQDTSQSQFLLLELLTSGWQPEDGRTLFLVGDPMQSIYRFRDTDLALFLRVRECGIGAVRCRALTLESNFRSAPAIVEWINATFSEVFPSNEDSASGSIPFSPSRATRPDDPEATVQVHALVSPHADDELERVTRLVAEERRRDTRGSLGILVQSRAHLAGLRERLHAAGVPARAVEIDPLSERQAVQDLIALTRALTHPADRIAWLAVLRAPWSGVEWRDLEALCGTDFEVTLRELLHDAAALANVGADGRRRMRRVAATLDAALTLRHTLPFPEWIEQTWKRLDGPDTLCGPADREAVEQFFVRLDALSRDGDLDDPARLAETFAVPAQPFASADASAVELLTIHKAKGLEFDTVVLFGLGREPRREEARALYWMERIARDGNSDLLMAPLSGDVERDRLGSFIRRFDELRERAERARLLYVATTRARRRLHMICRIEPDRARPAARSLLAPLWPAVADQFPAPAGSTAEPPEPEPIRPVLRRLRREISPGAPAVDAASATPAGSAPPSGIATHAEARSRPAFDWASRSASHIGTVVHRHLQRIARQGLDGWHATRVRASLHVFRAELSLLGLDAEEAARGAERVAAALLGVLEDPAGRWLLGAHTEARSELRLTCRRDGTLEHLRLDRTFVDETGTRWIVDFKTGSHQGADLRQFLDSEVERYQEPMQRYADAMRALESRPTTLALYFPLLKVLRQWPARESRPAHA